MVELEISQILNFIKFLKGSFEYKIFPSFPSMIIMLLILFFKQYTVLKDIKIALII